MISSISTKYVKIENQYTHQSLDVVISGKF